MDCAIGTGVMLVEEGDALNPVNFTAIPLPKVMLNNGPNNKVDTVFRKRQIPYNQLMAAYPKAEMSEKMFNAIEKNQGKKATIVEGVYKIYDEANTEKFKYCVACMNEEEIIFEKELDGIKDQEKFMVVVLCLIVWLQLKQLILQ